MVIRSNPSSSKDADVSASAGTQLNESVYTAIKGQILRNKLRPGVKLTHQGLAELLTVSRTPVREALERLYQEGYVVRIPRRGYFVGEIGADDVTDLYDAREALELFQTNHLIKPPSADQMKSLKRINNEYRRLIGNHLSRERLMVDREFHIKLASLSGNTYIEGLLEAIFDRLIMKRRIDGYQDRHGINLYEEHVSILKALEAGEFSLLSQLLRSHIRGARLRFLTFLKETSDDAD